MYIAHVNSKGKVTIPIEIRRLMNIKESDIIVFLEQDGKVFIKNVSDIAFDEVQKAFAGEAERAGLKDIDDVTALVKEIRAERQKNK